MSNLVVKKVLIAVVAVILIAGIIVGGVFAYFGICESVAKKKFTFIKYDAAADNGMHDRIHFLTTGSSDAILLESQGKFALIDCAEDNANPRGFKGLELKGYEQDVIDYVNRFAADENGQVTLEFIMGTHAHSDHIGGFDTLIGEDNITIKEAYFKRYYEDRISDYEVDEWDNLEMYNDVVNACNAKNIPLKQDLEGLTLTLGNFKLTIYNGQEAEEGKKVGENENSLAILVEKGDYRIMLSGDMNNIDGDEDRVAKEVGEVDVLKLGHHGYAESSTANYIDALKPKLAIQTTANPADISVKNNVTYKHKAPIYSTVTMNGIIIDITDKMILYNEVGIKG